MNIVYEIGGYDCSGRSIKAVLKNKVLAQSRKE